MGEFRGLKEGAMGPSPSICASLEAPKTIAVGLLLGLSMEYETTGGLITGG